MWRSKATGSLLRSLLTRSSSFSSIRSQVPFKATTFAVPSPAKWAPSICIPSLRSLSSSTEAVSGENAVENTRSRSVSDRNEAAEGQSWDLDGSDASSFAVEDGGERPLDFGDEEVERDANGDGVFTAEDDAGGEEEAEEIDMEQVESVQSLLRGSQHAELESSLKNLDLILSEEFVARALQTSGISGANLIAFFHWASLQDGRVKSSRNVGLLVDAFESSEKLENVEAYKLWDLIREIGDEKGMLNADILNKLISIFAKLGKSKAGLEVFNKFDEFGCNPNANTYYWTIQALSKRSMFDVAWSVCEKMLNSGILPDADKVGEIIAFLCKDKKIKEAHTIFLSAKEKEILLPAPYLDILITALSKKDETARMALELLDSYPKNSIRSANKIFGSVVHGLCKAQDTKAAKELLLRMVDSGPAPGNAVFNYVITALAKTGDVEDALALTKVMESRGLRPDIYTYSVIMSGFAKGGLMGEAYETFCQAKKRHSKLSPVSYHILIRGYCKMEEFEKAIGVLKQMKDDGLQPNTDEYNKLIQSLCLKALDWQTAEKLLDDMKEEGLHLKGITRSLIAAVKELEEETQAEDIRLEA